MGWNHVRYRPEVAAVLDEHGGPKEKRDEELWRAFTKDCDEAIAHIARDPRYEALRLDVAFEDE